MSDLLKKFEMIDNKMAEILRQKTEVERLRIGGRMWKSARAIVCGAIRTEHPTELLRRSIMKLHGA